MKNLLNDAVFFNSNLKQVHMDGISFSVFENIKETKPKYKMTIEEVVDCLRSSAFEEKITLLRNAVKRGDEMTAKKLKGELPAVTFAGIFSTRKIEALSIYSGLVCIDFDNVEDIAKTLSAIKVDPHAILAFRSPSGNGIKVVVRVSTPKNLHSKAYTAISAYFEKQLRIKADPLCKDLVRLCFLSHDSEVYYNPEASLFTVDQWSKNETSAIELQLPTNQPAASCTKAKNQDVESITVPEIKKMLASIHKINPRPEYDLWLRIINAVRSHCGDILAKKILSETFPEEMAGEYEEKFRHPCEQIEIGTLVKIAVSYGWKSDQKSTLNTKSSNTSLTLKAPVEDSLPEILEAPFPTNALPHALRELVTELAEVHRVPESLVAISALTIISGCIGSSVEAVSYEGQTRLNLYAVIAGERGSGKSRLFKDLMQPVIDVDFKMREDWRKLDSDREAQIDDLKDQLNASEITLDKARENKDKIHQLESELKRERCIVFENATSEAVTCLMADNCETLMCASADAGAVIDVFCGRYTEGTGDFDIALKGFSGDPTSHFRIGRSSVSLRRPCLSLLLLAQWEPIEQILSNPKAVERGVIARCMLFNSNALPEYVPANPRKFSSTNRQQWEKLLNRLLQTRFKSEENSKWDFIKATDEANEIFREYYNRTIDLRRGVFADVQGELSRDTEKAIRIAGVLALVENGSEITKAHAESAIAISSWCSSQLLGVIGMSRHQKLLKEGQHILELVVRHGGVLTGTILHDIGISGERRKHLLETAKKFEEFDVQIGVISSKGGKPMDIIKLK